MDLDEVVAQLWPGRSAVVTPLDGGITNHNYKAEVGVETFVLRIGGQGTELLGIDREHEHAASLAAASLEIGPEVVAFVGGCLVTRFIEGQIAPPEQLAPAVVAKTLRHIHHGPPIPARFDSFRVVEAYRRTVEDHGAAMPTAYADAARRAAAVEPRNRGRRLCLCHNDLLSANFIYDGSRLRIVDWEYAGMGDPLFDLGNFAANHGLDEPGEKALLEAYSGDAGHEALAGLRDMRFMSDFREAMWGLVQRSISDVDFDFAAYADEHFERALA